MNRYSKISTILFAFLISICASGTVRAQDDYRSYFFVVFETTVTQKGVETSDKNPQERRFYVSNIVEFPERDRAVHRNAMKIADDYFIANVVEPLKAKGFLHQYYDDAIRINNKVTYSLGTRADVEELREKTLQELKEQNANVFTFNWTRDKDTKGLETSQPTLLVHNPEQPLYGAGEKNAPTTKTNDKLTPPVKKNN